MKHRVTAPVLIATALLAVAAAVATASCKSSPTQVGLAQGCSINSDCNSPLICTFGLCHEACAQSRDCPMGERCVSSGSDNVCELPSETTCGQSSTASNCPKGLTCTPDMQCRNSCTGAQDCTPGQQCVGMACYDPMELAEAGTDAPTDAPGDVGNVVDSGAGDVSDGGCSPSGIDAGPLGFKPSNFDPNALAVVDGGLPDGGVNWSSPPDVTVLNTCYTWANPSCFGGPPATVSLKDGSQADVYVMHSFTVPTSAVANLSSVGSGRPIILAVLGTVDIQGQVNVSGGDYGGNGCYAGAGGYPVYGSGSTAQGPGGGGTGFGVLFPNSSASGGSFCGLGGNGSGMAPLASGGALYGTPDLVPLVGGSAGGYGSGTSYAGGGGGAIQISAGTSITVRAVGAINVGGGACYGGGGSGGAILLEAPAITIQGRLAANGASGGNWTDTGTNATPSDAPAAMTPTSGNGAGGKGSGGATVTGGDGAMDTGDAGHAPLYAYGTGGGGAGRIRMNTTCASASVEMSTAIISPYLTTSCATQGILNY